MTPTRRTLLAGASGLLAVSAGCIDDPSGSPAAGSGDGDDERDDAGSDGVRLERHDSIGFQQSTGPTTSPDVAFLLSEDEAETWLAARGLDEEPGVDDDADDRDDVDHVSDHPSSFVATTSFETSVLVALETSAPTPCHTLALEGVDIEDDTLVVEAAVRDEAAADEACAQMEVTVYRFVRAVFEDERATDLSATVVDRNGDAHGFGVGVDRADEGAEVDGEQSTDDGD